ncbi:MAG: DUF1045 domain-containing protein [Pseudomonadota bacterium]
MTDYRRYAVYYAPPNGSALAQFGAAWMGWDAEAGVEVPHPDSALDVAQVTATPRKYGFHGTLKPPFVLADGTDRQGLEAAVAALAMQHASFAVPIRLARLGRFCALVPDGPAPKLADLAANCVTQLDDFRAPPGDAELRRRRAKGLTAAQEAHLTRWGYPFVMDEFRFHLTLTGALDPADAPIVEAELARLTKGVTGEPLPVSEIALFGEAPDGRFRILSRHALTG